jgi:hypothetical protein
MRKNINHWRSSPTIPQKSLPDRKAPKGTEGAWGTNCQALLPSLRGFCLRKVQDVQANDSDGLAISGWAIIW